MEKVPETKEYKRCSLDNSYFITFSERECFMAVPRFVLLDKDGQILWSRAKQPSDPELKKDLDQLFD